MNLYSKLSQLLSFVIFRNYWKNTSRMFPKFHSHKIHMTQQIPHKTTSRCNRFKDKNYSSLTQILEQHNLHKNKDTKYRNLEPNISGADANQNKLSRNEDENCYSGLYSMLLLQTTKI